MQLLVRLVHAEPGCRVVEVTARRGDQRLGSALGEAANAEMAEDRAIQRLQQRLGLVPVPDLVPDLVQASVPVLPETSLEPVPNSLPPQALTPSAVQVPAVPARAATQSSGDESTADPDDWSGELAQIDLELRRIGWQREQEGIYLERSFGHPSRSRLTSYGDLLAYLRALQALGPTTDPAEAMVPLRRRDLLSQCDQLMAQLGWDAAEGRRCLEQHFQLSSRQQLSDAQLLQFNMLLEGQLIGV